MMMKFKKEYVYKRKSNIKNKKMDKNVYILKLRPKFLRKSIGHCSILGVYYE